MTTNLLNFDNFFEYYNLIFNNFSSNTQYYNISLANTANINFYNQVIYWTLNLDSPTYLITLKFQDLINVIVYDYLTNIYKNSNVLLLHDSKNIHPYILDYMLFNNQYFIAITDFTVSIFLGLLFLILGSDWSYQNQFWPKWWLWDISEVLGLYFCSLFILENHDRHCNDISNINYRNIFFYNCWTQDLLIGGIYGCYAFFIKLFSISHTFLSNEQIVEISIKWLYILFLYEIFLISMCKHNYNYYRYKNRYMYFIDDIILVVICFIYVYNANIAICIIYVICYLFIYLNIMTIYSISKIYLWLFHSIMGILLVFLPELMIFNSKLFFNNFKQFIYLEFNFINSINNLTVITNSEKWSFIHNYIDKFQTAHQQSNMNNFFISYSINELYFNIQIFNWFIIIAVVYLWMFFKLRL